MGWSQHRSRVRRTAGGLVARVDLAQRRHGLLGVPWAVWRKYADDQGARLAALLTYYGFLSLFPLLLLATAALTEVLRGHPELQRQMLDRLVRPGLRPDVEQALTQLPPSGVPLVVGLVSLLLAGTGGVLALDSALHTIWDVAWRDRYGLLRQYAGVFLVLILSFTIILLAAGSAVLTDAVLGLPLLQRGVTAAATVLALFAVLGTAHKVLVCRPLRWRDLATGGLLGAAVVTAVLHAAATVLPALIVRAGPVYGSFATVVGVFTVLYLISQTVVLSVELSAVLTLRLSPRGLTDADLTAADRRALTLLVSRQARVAGQQVSTTFPPDHVDHPGPVTVVAIVAIVDPAPAPSASRCAGGHPQHGPRGVDLP